MATSYDSVHATCPFFIGSNERTITCEGFTDRCKVRIEFRTKAERDQHREIFCNDKYGYCEVHRMVKEKYEDE